jgi:hypothetical protein
MAKKSLEERLSAFKAQLAGNQPTCSTAIRYAINLLFTTEADCGLRKYKEGR